MSAMQSRLGWCWTAFGYADATTSMLYRSPPGASRDIFKINGEAGRIAYFITDGGMTAPPDGGRAADSVRRPIEACSHRLRLVETSRF